MPLLPATTERPITVTEAPPEKKSLAIFAPVGLETNPPAKGDDRYYYDYGQVVTVTVKALEGYRYVGCIIFNEETLEQKTTPNPTVTLTMNYNYRLTFVGEKLPPPGQAFLTGKTLWWRIPVPKVAIDVNGYKTQTDLSGNFQVTVPLGSYLLLAENPLFNPYQETIDLTEEKTYETAIGLTMKLWVKIAAVGVPSAITGVALATRR